jgi:hypothetical protein
MDESTFVKCIKILENTQTLSCGKYLLRWDYITPYSSWKNNKFGSHRPVKLHDRTFVRAEKHETSTKVHIAISLWFQVYLRSDWPGTRVPQKKYYASGSLRATWCRAHVKVSPSSVKTTMAICAGFERRQQDAVGYFRALGIGEAGSRLNRLEAGKTHLLACYEFPSDCVVSGSI